MAIYYDYLTIEIREGYFSNEINLNNEEFYFEKIEESITKSGNPVLKFRVYVRTDSNIKKYIKNKNSYKANYYLLSSDGYFKKYIDIGTSIIETGKLSSKCYDYYCNRKLTTIDDEGNFYGTISSGMNENDYETTEEYYSALESKLVDKKETYENEIKKFVSIDEIYYII